MARSPATTTPPLSARLATLLDDAVGTNGLIAGQAADLLATEQEIGFELLEFIHRGKTGALFSASAVAGALTAGADAESVAALSAFAKNLGLAFQIIDDLLDVEGDPAQTGKARQEGRPQDDVRVVQRRGGRAPARRRAVPDGRPRAGAVRPACRPAARAVRVCRGAQHLTVMTSSPERRPSRRRTAAAPALRSATSTPASIGSCSGRRARRAARRRSRLLASLRVGAIAALLLGPAAALGLSARVPGLVTGPRDATRRRDLSRRLLRRGDDRVARSSPASPSSWISRQSRRPRRRARTVAVARAAGGLVTLLCLVYLTLWWQTVIAGLGWSAPVWTLSALALAAAISLLLGHAVAVASSAVILAGAGQRPEAERAPSTTSAGQSRQSWRTTIAAGALAFGGAALLLTWSAGSARGRRTRARRADGRVTGPAPARDCHRRLRRADLR